MSHTTLAAGIRHLRGRLALQQRREASDEELLRAFLANREEAAFAALVRQHGAMVLGICRRVLEHQQDAEDAFQATFLILARNAATLRNPTSLASFLHGIAYRTAMKAKQTAARRRKHEQQKPSRSVDDPACELLWREVRTVLDEEIARLPEIYRNVFVLCCLENLSRAEVARRLALKERTVLSRLAEARKRLQKRLRRRGIELTALLAAAAVMTPPASALPSVSLGRLTSDALSPAIAALAEGGLRLGKTKLFAVLLLAASVLSGAGLWQYQRLAAQTAAATPPAPAKENPAAATPKKKAEKKTLEVRGRVLDPDGKPVEGAQLYSPHLLKDPPEREEDFAMIERGSTDAEGHFRLSIPRSDVPANEDVPLVAQADGYGVDWTQLPAADSDAELTLRLVQDQEIRGRLVSTEGKPLAGVHVRVLALLMKPGGPLDDYLIAWERDWQLAGRQAPKQTALPTDARTSVVTDRNGRFRISGIGRERVALLQVRGAGLAHATLTVIARPGFDPAPWNKAVRARMAAEQRVPIEPPPLFGPSFEYVAVPTRIIEGTVRERESGRPVAGYTISHNLTYNDSPITAVSDARGRYRLVGLPKMKKYLLDAEPPEKSPWLRAGARVEDTEGLQPLTIDFTVARGIVVTGRVIDQISGKGVQSGLRYAPLPDNEYFGKAGYDSYRYERLTTPTDAEGRFRIVVLPGPGALMAQAWAGATTNGGQAVNPYKQAELSAEDRKCISLTEREDGERIFLAADNSVESLNLNNAVRRLDLTPGAGSTVCDLYFIRGQTLEVKVQDAEGKPLTGAAVTGISATGTVVPSLRQTSCTIFALDQKKPRLLLFLHRERQLAGTLSVRGDEKEPPVARLVRTGSIKGRLLDRDGQPLAGVEIDLSFESGDARELYRRLDADRPPIYSDKEGRFRIDGIIPGLQFGLGLRHGREFLVGEPRIGLRQVKPGSVLDLGEVRVKPAR